jgi:hypothetical protein
MPENDSVEHRCMGASQLSPLFDHSSARGSSTPIRNLSFRATGIKAYLKNGDTLEKAAAMANHASILPRRDISGSRSN